MKVTGEGQRSQKWTNGHISQTITLTDIIPGTKVRYHQLSWPWSKVKVTTQGQRSQPWRCLRSLTASCLVLSYLISYLVFILFPTLSYLTYQSLLVSDAKMDTWNIKCSGLMRLILRNLSYPWWCHGYSPWSGSCKWSLVYWQCVAVASFHPVNCWRIPVCR